jgi:hypothetical protein
MVYITISELTEKFYTDYISWLITKYSPGRADDAAHYR